MFELLDIYGDIISNAIIREDWDAARLYQYLYKAAQRQIGATPIEDLDKIIPLFISLN
jgi:hypothetical protein